MAENMPGHVLHFDFEPSLDALETVDSEKKRFCKSIHYCMAGLSENALVMSTLLE